MLWKETLHSPLLQRNYISSGQLISDFMHKTEWYESAAFKRALLREQGARYDWKFGLLFTMGMALLIGGAAHWHQKPVGGSWELTYLIAFSPGLLITGVIPMIERLSTNRIVVSDKGLTRSVVRGGAVQLFHWSWDRIESAEVGVALLDGIEFPALWIRETNGDTFPVAISPLTDHQFLRSVFAMKDKPYVGDDLLNDSTHRST